MGTDNEEAHGCACASQAALRLQIPSQAGLHGIVQTHRPSRFASDPAFRALREIKNLPRIGIQKKTGHARFAGMAGFLKRHLQARL